MLDNHPIARWAAVATLVASFAAGTYFIMDERERSIEQSDRLAEIRHEQEEIRRELSAQTLILNRIEDNQSDTMRSSDQRFSTRANEHRWLSSEINRVIGGVTIELGKLQQLHKGDPHNHNSGGGSN